MSRGSVVLVLFFALNTWAPNAADFSVRDHNTQSNINSNYQDKSTAESVSFIRNKRFDIQPRPPRLINDENCKEIIRKVCPSLPDNADDLTVLECIQAKSSLLRDEKCQHTVYERVRDLIANNDHLRVNARSFCKEDVEKLLCPKGDQAGQFLACALDNIEDFGSDCQAYFQRIERVAFSDFRVFEKFMDVCKDDISSKKCGRLKGDATASSQKGTLDCLQDFLNDITESCRHEVLRLSVFQSENVRLDFKLNAACAEDQRRFCPEVHPGSGKVYKCLMQFRLDRSMSEACQLQLVKYQRLVSQNYRVSHGLVRACKEDIRQYRCRRSVPDDRDIRLAKILLCLEGYIRNGSKVSRDCQIEMMEHRKMLMEDYRLSPEIVSRCSEDIKMFCDSLEVGGKTIHCLMEHARLKRKKERVSDQCQRALEVLVKDVDAGEDWRVDPVLREACKPVVDVACQDVRGGEARVIHCLIEHIGTSKMTEPCESAILQIQYFVARDYKLDPQLFQNCHEDAVRFCHGKKAWYDESGQMDPERGPLVLPCLYRYAYHPVKERKLKKQCLEEVKRVMQERAMSVDLSPEVERVCLDDLAQHCVDKTERGQEMLCLQEHLEDLQSQCREVITNFTEDQAGHIELNPVIATTCKAVMLRHCEMEYKSGRDEGGIMECLVKHKNEADVRDDYKCRAAIEHYQLISLKDYHFTYKFMVACRTFVLRYCRPSTTKYDVISCLSEIVRNDTMSESRPSIDKDCRKQLKAQLFHQRENVHFDPKLKESCAADIKKLCPNIEEGSSKVLECLRLNRKELSKQCHKSIFKVEQELAVHAVDYTLTTTCASMITTFCHNEVETNVFSCLKLHRDEPAFDPDCHKVIIQRMIEQSSDYRLNVDLSKACRSDIKTFCKEILLKHNPDEEFEGEVVKCLKEKFRAGMLRKPCENQMEVVLREAALNYELNPLLTRMCANDIKRLCMTVSEPETDGYGQGAVEECLKENFRKGLVNDKLCRVEILAVIDEGRADIHVDPHLYQACLIDLRKYCAEMQQGSGRLIRCLSRHLTDPQIPLQHDCHEKLSQRVELFDYIKQATAEPVRAPPETVGELIHHVKNFPATFYFLVVCGIAATGLVVIGIFLGKVTNRRMANKIK